MFTNYFQMHPCGCDTLSVSLPCLEFSRPKWPNISYFLSPTQRALVLQDLKCLYIYLASQLQEYKGERNEGRRLLPLFIPLSSHHCLSTFLYWGVDVVGFTSFLYSLGFDGSLFFFYIPFSLESQVIQQDLFQGILGSAGRNIIWCP